MDLNRLSSLVAAPMASLFLVLALCAFVGQRPGAVGMNLPIVQVRTVSYGDCEGVDRDIVVLLHKDGSYWLNEEKAPTGKLGSKLSEIYLRALLKTFCNKNPAFGSSYASNE